MSDILIYNQKQTSAYKESCDVLQGQLYTGLPEAEAKVWHGHPVWFLDGNPIVGYSVQKAEVRRMFWSGRSFDETGLTGTSRFKDASVFYSSAEEINNEDLARWFKKSEKIQWDYKNIVKRKGKLEKIGNW